MSATFLVYIETRDGKVRPGSLEAASAAARFAGELGGEAVGAMVGPEAEALAAGLGARGLARVMVTDDPALARFTQEGYAQAVVSQARAAGATHLFFSHTIRGRELAPRVAQKLDAGMASEIVSLERDGERLVAERPIYAGKLLAKVEVHGNPAVYSLRPKAFQAPESAPGKKAEVVRVAYEAPASGIRAAWRGFEPAASVQMDVSEAEFLVSGGRGCKSAEGFKPLVELAKVLGGAVACSRPAAEVGWWEHADHVGQTGKIVSPTLYIACGISGAIQHMAGVSSAKVIVAINKDANAPVFERADYGIVGDLFEVVPALTEALRAVKE